MLRVVESILDFIFPTSCLFCKNGDKTICINCFLEIPQKFRNEENIISLYEYRNEKVNKLLWKLKYHHSNGIAKLFGKALAENIKERDENIVLIPIPLSESDKRMHNHANLIALAIRENLSENVKIIPDLLIKKQKIKQAHTKGRVARLSNVKGIFSINPKYSLDKNTYIIIDDVTTTGATINEARLVLGEFLKINQHEVKEKILAITIAH